MELHSGTCSLPRGPALMVHGGAWNIPLAETDAHLDGMREALARGSAVLERGGEALAAVCAAVAAMEASGIFDAGRGSVLTRSGQVEMDAGVMCGSRLAFGSVATVTRTVHPILAARAVMEHGQGQVRLMVGSEAEAFAEACGVPTSDPGIHPREQARWDALRLESIYHTSDSFVGTGPKGTVGCVARDDAGRVAAGTSTGGTPFRREGRVGDSPLPGCGFYADHAGAASATGWGEAIASAGLCGRVVRNLEQGQRPEAAIRSELDRMRRRLQNPQGEEAAAGMIVVTAEGDAAWAFNTPRMARGSWNAAGEVWVGL